MTTTRMETANQITAAFIIEAGSNIGLLDGYDTIRRWRIVTLTMTSRDKIRMELASEPGPWTMSMELSHRYWQQIGSPRPSYKLLVKAEVTGI